MKEKILALMQQKNYKSSDSFGLSKQLSNTREYSFSSLTKALFELEKEGTITKNKKNQYNLVQSFGYLKGVIDLKAQGYGFVKLEDKDHPDVFIPASKVNGAMDKDTVLTSVSKEKYGNRFDGEIVKVLKRHFDTIVGEYHQGAIFIKDNPQNIIFRVRKNQKVTLVDHTLVKAKVMNFKSSYSFDCDIIEILGNMSDPLIDIIEVLNSHDLSIHFPDEVVKQAKSVHPTIENESFKGRIDLRNELIFTIDGDDTKDIDDAISIKKNENGLYTLGAHIADVSYYVTKDSPLDKEAFNRGTSVYLANQVIPMLPRELSNGICSLNPQVDRFAISCIMQINAEGEVVSYDILPTIIRSRHQMTYNNVNLMLNKDASKLEEFSDITETIILMSELAKILSAVRTKMGSINFETIEPKLVFNSEGRVADIVIKKRGESEGIIEEFMLVANQVIASHFDSLELPFIYRIHEAPDADKLTNLFKLAKELAYITHIPNPITHQDLQKLLADVDDTKYDKVVNTMMLRSMAKAKYSEENLGHYGLAFQDYTHFTSPIRRYPDLIVHRYIRDYIFLNKRDALSVNKKIDELPEIAKQTSLTERNAMIAEREVMDIKKAEYMEPFVGETFEGVISSVMKFGLFVELPNTVEGLVHISTFKEAIEFIEDKMIFLGITSRIEYTIGMIVKVKCISTVKSLGRVDFELV